LLFGMQTKTEIGIGGALEKARVRRGKSLEEASRDTMLRIDYLQALEREDFESLGGEVYARGFLRSYSRYLGLNPDKVMAVYRQAFGLPTPVPLPAESPPGVPSSGSEIRALLHRRPSWPLAALAAAIVFLAAAAVGLLNRDASTPSAAPLSAPSKVRVLPPGVRVDLAARTSLHASIEVDGQLAFSGTLDRGDVRSFEAERRIDVELEWGDSVRLKVNGTNIGTPGKPNQPFLESFDPSSYRKDGSGQP
jgi:helix-turn-helix protein